MWTGLREALALRRRVESLGELLEALHRMEAEIAFSCLPFGPLCRGAAEAGRGRVRDFFAFLAREAASPECQSKGLTRRAAAEAGLALPEGVLRPLERLFDDFGRWDREGQLDRIRLTQAAVNAQEAALREGLSARCRSCGILGFCGGAALLVMVL